MAPSEINERGYFWWSDESTHQGHFAPDRGVYGSLTVDIAGVIRLDLDSNLPHPHGPFAAFAEQDPTSRSICGLLKESSRRVLLTNLHRSGASFRSNALSHESYRALIALISVSSSNENYVKPPPFRRVQLPLNGYESWLKLDQLEVDQQRDETSITYKNPKSHTYRVYDGAIVLRYALSQASEHTSGTLSLRQGADLTYLFRKPITIETLIDEHRAIEDLLLVLTDVECNLDWPIGYTERNTSGLRIYYSRSSRSEKIESWTDCWILFPELSNFGEILAAWRQKRSDFGPAFYMYLGTRRGMQLYVENRFLNLIFGLESYHRTAFPNRRVSRLDRKIERILCQINSKKDVRWLSRQLKYCAEPNLEDRLVDIFRSVPVNTSSQALRTFAKKCGKYRNDISHYGGARDVDARASFVPTVAAVNEALDTLYHLTILKEIGVKDQILQRLLDRGFHSFRLKHGLWLGGFLDKDPRKNPTPKTNTATIP